MIVDVLAGLVLVVVLVPGRWGSPETVGEVILNDAPGFLVAA